MDNTQSDRGKWTATELLRSTTMNSYSRRIYRNNILLQISFLFSPGAIHYKYKCWAAATYIAYHIYTHNNHFLYSHLVSFEKNEKILPLFSLKVGCAPVQHFLLSIKSISPSLMTCQPEFVTDDTYIPPHTPNLFLCTCVYAGSAADYYRQPAEEKRAQLFDLLWKKLRNIHNSKGTL